jgi:hypothetical protein
LLSTNSNFDLPARGSTVAENYGFRANLGAVKWFLTRRVPPVTRVLLIESGPRDLCQRLIPRLRTALGASVPIDVLTCLPDNPEGLGDDAIAWRTLDAASASERWALLRTLRGERHPVVAMLCADDAIMGPWRFALLLMLRAKFLIVNENADFFWLDRGNAGTTLKFLLTRMGLRDPFAARTLARLAVFPFTLAYLLLFAARVHIRRALRLARSGRTH